MKEIKTFNKIKNISVVVFILLYILITYILLRGEYLECAELGEQYIQNFWTNIKYKYIIMGISFFIIEIIMTLTNIGIKKGLKLFFENEKKEIPKLPNKSISFIVAIIGSIIISDNFVEQVLLFTSNVSFQKVDIVFGLDISYYMFIKPLIENIILYLLKFIIFLSAYITAYYIIVFNFFFDGIDRTLLKKSKLVKNLLRNVIICAILVSINTIFSTQNILTDNFLTLDGDIQLYRSWFYRNNSKIIWI